MAAGASPIPTLGNHLPALAEFVGEVRAAVAGGEIAAHAAFVERCRDFYTDARMAEITAVVPRWTAMASFADGMTLWHTTAALVATQDLDEYRFADPHQRLLMDWIVLLHDVAKEPSPDRRDHRHAFRSAAAAGATLPHVGFEVTDAWAVGFDDWHRLTDSAQVFDPAIGDQVQDNRRLPEIVAGVDRLFGLDAALILKAILLHLSVTVVPEWPAPAPLTRAEERRYLDDDLRPLLHVMMQADHGGWNLFDPETLQEMYRETRTVFARLADAIR